MTAFSVSTTQTAADTLTGDDTLEVTSSGLLKPAGPAVLWNLATAQGAGVGVVVTVDSGGSIAPTSGRAFDTTGTATAAVSFTLDNNGSITGVSDVARFQKSLDGGSISIDNTGTITADAGRGFNVQEFNTLHDFSLTNHDGATIQSTDDAVRLTTGVSATYTGTLEIDNAGTIETTGAGSGQALDLNDVTATAIGQVHVTNESTGMISSGDADAIRGAAFATIDNHGTIISHNFNVSSTGNDGIDFQANAGGVINNYEDASITGARHGVTGDNPVAITNDGTITGQLGSGVNLDTLSSTTTTITNQAEGVISGTAGGTSDGDGIDVDGLITLHNSGLVEAFGVWTGGLSESVTVGGGEIDNYAGGEIYSVQRAITVDDSNDGDAFAATTIYNEGLIQGDNGEAISITDTFADTLTNKGTITGSIALGGGGDVVDLYAGASQGAIDGGDGSDTIHLIQSGTTAGTLASATNVETLDVDGGAWTLSASDGFTSGVTIASGASLQVGDGTTNGALTGAVSDAGGLIFDRSDAIEFDGAVSGHGTLQQSGAGTLTLGGHSSFDGGVTLTAGALELATTDAAGAGAITFEAGAQTLILDTAAFDGGALDQTLTGFGMADTIDLKGVGLAIGVGLDGDNSLTIYGGSGGAVALHFDDATDFSGDRFHLVTDGAGGTDVTYAADVAPVASAGTAEGGEDTRIAGSVAAVDADGDTLTYVLASGPAHGQLTFNADGSYSYQGDLNYNGSDSFTFEATDGDLHSNIAGVSLTIDPVNDDPVIAGGGMVDGELTEAGVGGSGLAFAKTTPITFTDPDTGDTPHFDTTGWSRVGSSSDYTLTGEYGTATLDIATGVVSYHLDNADPDTQALNSGDHVRDYFSVTVIDGNGGSASTEVVFDILGQNDAVVGTAGADSLTGNGFDDLLKGGAGDDTLVGGKGDDTLQGGAGSDTASFASSRIGVTADLATGAATGEGTDRLVSIENLIGSNKADTLTGDSHANLLDGGAGNDVLVAGGAGDTLVGGAGSDRFLFESLAASSNKAPVLIADLTEQDRIDLSQIDANVDKAGDQRFKLVDAFTHHAGQLTLSYDATHDRTVLSVDVDGDAKADLTVWISGDQTGFSHFVL